MHASVIAVSSNMVVSRSLAGADSARLSEAEALAGVLLERLRAVAGPHGNHHTLRAMAVLAFVHVKQGALLHGRSRFQLHALARYG